MQVLPFQLDSTRVTPLSSKNKEKQLHEAETEALPRIDEGVTPRHENVLDITPQQPSLSRQGSGITQAQGGAQEQLRLENENLRLEVQRLRWGASRASDAPPSYSDPALS